MKTVRWLIGVLILPLLAFAGCHELGHDGLGDYGGISSNNITGEIQYVDTRALEIEIRADNGRTSVVRYDNNTRVVYQNRNYAVSNLEPGDYVAVRAQQDRNGRLYTDLVTVSNSAQNRVYGGTAGVLRGTVQRNDPRYSSFLMETEDKRQVAFYHDAKTRVLYRNRDYPVQSIQAGDTINVRTRDRSQQTPTADLITVVTTAQDRTGTGAIIGRLETLEGRVEYVDSRRGLFELRGPSNRLVVVNLQYNPPRTVSDRFNRMREGETVRIDGRFINQDRFELESFR